MRYLSSFAIVVALLVVGFGAGCVRKPIDDMKLVQGKDVSGYLGEITWHYRFTDASADSPYHTTYQRPDMVFTLAYINDKKMKFGDYEVGYNETASSDSILVFTDLGPYTPDTKTLTINLQTGVTTFKRLERVSAAAGQATHFFYVP